MRATTRKPGKNMTALLASVVVAVVLGILGMHALTIREVPATGGSQMAPADGMPHTDMAATRGQPMSAHAGGTASGDQDNGHHGHGMSDMVMLCVAVLAAAAGTLLLLVLTWRRGPRLWAYLAAVPLAVPKLLNARLGTGPPPVWQFSVIRC